MRISPSLLATLTIMGTASLAPAIAQDAPALSPKLEAQTKFLMMKAHENDLGYRTIESLTTEVGPRLAGSEAEARARAWAVAYLKDLGFKNVRIETFDIPYWERTHEHAAITAPFPQPLIITALGGTVGTPEGGVEAEIIRFETLNALKALPMDDSLRGKIVFVDETMTRTQDGSGYGVAVQKRSGAAIEAGKRGAVAAIIRSVGTDHDRLPHTGGMRYDKDTPRVAIAALSAPDADQLARALKRGSVTISLDIGVVAKESVVSGNVIAEIPGKTNEIVVIGAHLDSWDLGTGAVDDGAGVGIVVGAAGQILKYRKKPLRTIRVVLFGAEEIGLKGAFAYAEQHKDEMALHVMGAESDFGAGRIYQFQTHYGEEHQDLGDAMARVLEPLGIARGDNNAGGGPDMVPIKAAGVPVTSLRQNGWDYFDLHHTGNDTLDKINPADIAQNVAAYAAFTWMAANAPSGFRDDKEAADTQ